MFVFLSPLYILDVNISPPFYLVTIFHSVSNLLILAHFLCYAKLLGLMDSQLFSFLLPAFSSSTSILTAYTNVLHCPPYFLVLFKSYELASKSFRTLDLSRCPDCPILPPSSVEEPAFFFSNLNIIIQLSWLHEYKLIPMCSILFYSFVYLVFGSCSCQ